MAEYIEREAALEALCKVSVPTFSLTGEPILDVDYVPAINAIPAADVAPVVRCKHCKHSAHDWQGNRYCGLIKTYNIVEDDWFCADGEREDGDGDV